MPRSSWGQTRRFSRPLGADRRRWRGPPCWRVVAVLIPPSDSQRACRDRRRRYAQDRRERIRLVGLDAPELAQTCTDANGANWDCGGQAQGVRGLARRAPDRHLPSSRTRRLRPRSRKMRFRRRRSRSGRSSRPAGLLPISAISARPARRADGKRGIWAGSFIAARRVAAGPVMAHGTNLWDWITSWFQQLTLRTPLR